MFLTNRNADKASVIDGADIVFNTGRVIVKGAWESDSNITFAGGAGLSHGNIYFEKATGVNPSLTLTGTLKNDKDANTWGAINVGGGAKIKDAVATLDITKAKFASTGNSGSLVSLIAENKGTVKVTGEQVTSILKGDANTKGFHLSVVSGGKLDILSLIHI